jgi:predicted nucleic acid-binding Zn ribbon protein
MLTANGRKAVGDRGHTLPQPVVHRHQTVNCSVCGAPIQQQRRTKVYCSDACRKASKRAAAFADNSIDLEIRDQLRSRQLIGQVWPVYRWDPSPPVFGLLVPRAMAKAELAISDDELVRVLRRFGIVEGEVEVGLNRRFREARKDRRVERDEALSRTEFPGRAHKHHPRSCVRVTGPKTQ